MAEKRKWSAYGAAITVLFWLSWLAFCTVMVATCRTLAVTVERIFWFSAVLLWFFLLGIFVRRNSGWGVLVLILLPVIGAFWPAVMIDRLSPEISCLHGMHQVGAFDTWQKNTGASEKSLFASPEIERWFWSCALCRPFVAGDECTYHFRVEVPVAGVEERFCVVSHVKMEKPADDFSWVLSYQQWKERVNATFFQTPFGLPLMECQNRTVLVVDLSGKYVASPGLEDETQWQRNERMGLYPLSAAGFEACVDGAGDADTFYQAVRKTSKTETLAYERYRRTAGGILRVAHGLPCVFLLLIIIRMFWWKKPAAEGAA